MKETTTISTQDLYGVSPKVFKEMYYEEVLDLKIKILKEKLNVLYDVHYLDRDEPNIRKISKALKFNEQLKKELY